MSQQPLLYNQHHYNPNYNPAAVQQPVAGYPTSYGYHQQPPSSIQYYPPPQGYVPPQQHNVIQPTPVQYGTMPPASYVGGPHTYVPVGGGNGYNQQQPAVDPYHTFYQQAHHMNDNVPVGDEPLPQPETMPVRAVPKPQEIHVSIHLRKSICFFVISLVTIVLWPVLPFTICALMCSLRARALHNKRNHKDANQRGADAKCGLTVSLVITIAWCLILMGASLIVLLFWEVFYNL